MQFEVEALALETAVKLVAKITGLPSEGVIQFVATDSGLVLSAASKGTAMSYKLAANLTKSKITEFSVLSGTLLTAITRRKTLTFEVKPGVLTIRGDKGYNAELVTSTLDALVVIPKDVKQDGANKLSADLVDFLAETVAAIELKPSLTTVSCLPVAVKVTDKGATLVCYDNWHMAFSVSKEVKGNLSLCVPTSSLLTLTREFRGHNYKLVATDAALYAYNSTFEVALSLPQQDEQNAISPEAAFALVNKIRKTQGSIVSLNVEDLATVVANMDAVHRKGEHVDFVAKAGKCQVTIKSTHGRVTDVVRAKCDTPVRFRTGFSFLRDSLTKATGSKVELVVEPQMMFWTDDTKTVMMALLPVGGDE